MGEQSEGTFLGEFGLKAYGTVLEVRVDENGYMSGNYALGLAAKYDKQI